jgi:signal transduction histidine kinase
MRDVTVPWNPVEALEVFVGLLDHSETATPRSTAFYDHLCEATSRLAGLSRAVVFLWDEDRHRVRAAGSANVSLEAFDDVRVSASNVPIARTALIENRVVFTDRDFEEAIPPLLAERLQPRNLACTPMSASGRSFGVIMGERESDGALTDTEAHTLWMLGKVAALAASARVATRHQERSRQLDERIALARDLHERVTQRLFGLGLALGVEGPLSDEARERCLQEVGAASRELAAAMQRPLSPLAEATDTRLADELERLAAQAPMRPVWEPDVAVPERFEALAQAVLAEALRNARKHARPTGIDIALAREGDALVLQVVNDGTDGQRPSSGLGLKLAALEALHQGALVEFGPEGRGRWKVRLVMPLEDPTP